MEPACCSFHVVKALALPCLSKRAMPKAPRRCKYIIHPPYQRTQIRPKPKRAVYNTPHRASPLLCSWQTVELARFLLRQNQSVSYAFIYVYVSPPYPIRGLSARITIAKITVYNDNVLYFNRIFLGKTSAVYFSHCLLFQMNPVCLRKLYSLLESMIIAVTDS